MKRAIFLDRDGVINVDNNYVYKKNDLIFMPGIFSLVKLANFRGYKVIVITNQAGIGRGFYKEKDFIKVSRWMQLIFNQKFGNIDDIFFCPYHPIHGIGNLKKESFNRKPNPGMLFDAKDKYNIDMGNSILIGDNISDMKAGENAGVGNLLLFGNIEKNSNYKKIHKLSEAFLYLKDYKNPFYKNILFLIYFLKNTILFLLSNLKLFIYKD